MVCAAPVIAPLPVPGVALSVPAPDAVLTPEYSSTHSNSVSPAPPVAVAVWEPAVAEEFQPHVNVLLLLVSENCPGGVMTA